jgi:hypothetical protein
MVARLEINGAFYKVPDHTPQKVMVKKNKEV